MGVERNPYGQEVDVSGLNRLVLGEIGTRRTRKNPGADGRDRIGSDPETG